MNRIFLCGCGCGAVNTFEDNEMNKSITAAGASNPQSSPSDALLLAFQRLPDRDLIGLVTSISKSWQATASATLATRIITIDGLQPGSKKTASVIAWLRRYCGHISELHIHHADVNPDEWAAILSLPYTKLNKLQLTRSKLSSGDLSLLTQLTSLQELTLNSVGTQLRVSFVHRLGTCLSALSSLDLKSCGIGGEHLQGLTPLVQGGLASLDLFDNPGIGEDVGSSNKALQMWTALQPAGPSASEAAAAAPEAEVEAAGSREASKQQQQQQPEAPTLEACSNGEAVSVTAAVATVANTAAAVAPEQVEVITAATTAGHESSSTNSSPAWQQQDQAQEQEQHKTGVLGSSLLRQLQLSYCHIRHLPALSQLTSLTSLNLQENSCDRETVEALGQLQQLQELVLEEGVGCSTPAAAFTALSSLSNLELLDLSGAPTGCLEKVFGGAATDVTPPGPTADKTGAATAGWHGLRVKWSGRGRPPPGFRLPEGRTPTSSTGGCSTSCSSPGSARDSPRTTGTPRVTNESEAAGAAALTIGALPGRSSQDSGVLMSPAQGPLSPAVPTPSVAIVEESTAIPSLVFTGCGAAWGVEDGGCSGPLPRLKRLEAEEVGLSDSDVSAIVHCCSQLRELDISHNHVGPEGIAKLQSLSALTHLNISTQQPQLNDSAATALVQLKQLKGLDVGGNSFSKQIEVQLQREGSSAGGHLTRLTGCGMREEVSEPWVGVSMEREQKMHHHHNHQHHQQQHQSPQKHKSPANKSPTARKSIHP